MVRLTAAHTHRHVYCLTQTKTRQHNPAGCWCCVLVLVAGGWSGNVGVLVYTCVRAWEQGCSECGAVNLQRFPLQINATTHLI